VTEHDQWEGSLGDPESAGEVARATEILRRPPEELLAVGGDGRQVPRAGRNTYGFALCDLAPVVRGSSCTATPPDAIALADADRWRTATLAGIEATGALPTADILRAGVVDRLVARLALEGAGDERVLLTPSGTDAEVLVAALVLAAQGRRVRNILVGAAEAGSGTRLAAAGRQFSTRAPFRPSVVPGATIAGFDADAITIVDVELRDARGRVRRAFDVEAEVEAHVEDAIERDEQVVVHAMAASKTGVHQLDPDWVRLWRERYPDRLRVVVDAAQGRCTPAGIRAYMSAGAGVSITGSKALCGPPFCGALLLDDALIGDARAALERGVTVPSGLADMVSAVDVPAALRALFPPLQRANLGLVARWTVALDEADRFSRVPLLDRDLFVSEALANLRNGLGSMDRIRPLSSEPSSTILSFVLLDAVGEPLPKDVVVEIYEALVSRPGVQIGQPVQIAASGATALRFAIGATTVTRAIDADASPTRSARGVAATALGVLREMLPDFLSV
jgi:hypothetical protein